jgi:hypothetical protein
MQEKTFGTNESNYFLFTNMELVLTDQPHLNSEKRHLKNDVSLSSSSLSYLTPSGHQKNSTNRDDLA